MQPFSHGELETTEQAESQLETEQVESQPGLALGGNCSVTTASVSAPLGGGEEQGSSSLPAPGSSPRHQPGVAHLPARTPHILGHRLDSIRLKFDPG